VRRFAASDAARLARPLVGAVAAVSREGSGWDHVAWRVDAVDGSAWIVRAALGEQEPDWAESVRREVAVMALARGRLGAIVADAVVLDEATRCLAHRRLPGVSLQELVAHDRVPVGEVERLAGEIGAMVATIATIDPAASPEPVPHDDDSIDAWRGELPTFIAEVDHLLTAGEHAAVERFLAAVSPPPPEAAELVLCHNDLGGEHLLVDPTTFAITGVIDWTDAAVADPAAEVGRLLRDLGAPRLDALLDGIGASGVRRAALVERAWAYARCLVLEDLAHAVQHRPDLVAYEQASASRLFAGM
jgi:aminoglycoside phosphotransferase (APT) family kinase protein